MDLIVRAAKLGEEVNNKFIEVAKGSKVIGEVRGKGLMIGLELVKNKRTREPVTKLPEIVKKIREQGVISMFCGRHLNVLRLMPPLVISRTLFDKAIDIVLYVLKENEADLMK